MSRKRLARPAQGAPDTPAHDQLETMLRDEARAYLGVLPKKVPSDLAPYVERLNSAAEVVSSQLCREDNRAKELPVRGEPGQCVVLANSTIRSGLEALKWSHAILTFAVLYEDAAGCFEVHIQYNVETRRTRSVKAVPITREEARRWFVGRRELAPEHLRPRARCEPSTADAAAANPPDSASPAPKPEEPPSAKPPESASPAPKPGEPPPTKPPDFASHAPEPEEPPPETTEIDFDGIATELHKQGKHTQARLVGYMAAKAQAQEEEIAEFVHEDEEASRSAIWNNAKRTSDSLLTLCPLLSFQFVGSIMYRTITPE
jgi:hypothetical protein